MQDLTLTQRAAGYAQAFPDYPPVQVSGRWLYAHWYEGNYWQGSGLYGSYPPSFIRRVMSLFPDATRILHLFSGSVGLEPRAPGEVPFVVTLDLRVRPEVHVLPSVQGHAQQLPFRPGSFDLILADPPYGPEQAARYGTKMPNRRLVFSSLPQILVPGGHLVWLDTYRPMYRADQWRWWGSITLVRSTNQVVREAFCYQRRLQPGETWAFEAPAQAPLFDLSGGCGGETR